MVILFSSMGVKGSAGAIMGFTHRFMMSRGPLKSGSLVMPPLTIKPFPLVTLITSRAAAHQLRFMAGLAVSRAPGSLPNAPE